MSVFPLVNTLTSEYAPSQPGVCYENDHFLAELSARDPEGQSVTYYLVAGSLPIGMTLNPLTGTISGTGSLVDIANSTVLEQDYTWTFSIGAYDGVNPPTTDPQEFSITVRHIPRAPSWGGSTGGTLFTLYEGDTIANAVIQTPSLIHEDINGLQLIGATDPQGLPISYTVTSGSLPSGISMSTEGVFTGSLPDLNQNYIPLSGTNFAFTVTGSNGYLSSSINCAIFVNNKNVSPYWITPSGSIGAYPEFSPMSFQLQAGDVDGNPLTYSIVGGALEQGVTLSSTGLISGTPVNPVQGQDNTDAITVAVSNPSFSANIDLTVTFTNVNLPPVWVSPNENQSLSVGVGGTPVSVQMIGTDPQNYTLTYSVSGGNFPNSLSLSAAGALTGTLPIVTANTVYDFTVSMTNGYFSVTRDFNVTANVIPDIAPQWVTPSGSLGSGYPNFAFTPVQLAATSEQGHPLSYYLSSGALPGLTLSSAGYLSGTLSNVSAQTTDVDFTIDVTDGQIAVPQSFSITVYATPHGSEAFTANSSFVVPIGVVSLTFTWIIGGGGGGGGSMEKGNGGGGGGGGAGGNYQSWTLAVNPGDTISVFIGQAGYGQQGSGTYNYAEGIYSPYDGTAGGDTYIQQNGVEVVRATGGSGGQASENNGGGYIAAPGGAGGSPNGAPGAPGQAGTNDYASSNGGNGGTGPMPGSVGGSGGNTGAGPSFANLTTLTGSSGVNGVGYGSAGGGAGNADRTNPLMWYGGTGVQGYVLMTY